MKNLKLNRTDIILIIVILIIALIIKFSAIKTIMLAGDSVSVAALVKNLSESLSYSINGQPHMHWPPLFPLVVALINIFVKNPIISLKITSVIISSLTLVVVYIFARKLNLSKSLSVIATLLVLFNPFFLYYAGGILPLPESLSVFLFTLGLFFYFSESGLLMSGVLFGLCMLTKLNYFGFLLPFLFLHAYYIIKTRKLLHLNFLIFILLPPLLWLMRNKLLSPSSWSEDYFKFFSIEHFMQIPYLIEGYAAALIYLFLPLILLMIGWFVYYSRKKGKLRYNGKNWCLVGLSALCFFVLILFLNPYYNSNLLHFSISRTRFFVSLVPIFTLLTISFFSNIKPKLLNVIKIYLIIVVLSFIIFSTLLTNGFVISWIDFTQNSTLNSLSNTFIKRSFQRTQAIDWINNNLPKNSKLLVYFNEDLYGMQGIEVFYNYYFNQEFEVISLKETNDKVLFPNIVSFKDIDGLTYISKEFYVISDVNIEDIKKEIKLLNLNNNTDFYLKIIEQKEIYSTAKYPYVKVFKLKQEP